RNVATLVGLSLIVLLAYLMQGYFDALRTRMLSRIATLFDAGLQEPIHVALATLPLRGVKPLLAQQPLRDLQQIRTFLSGCGPPALLDVGRLRLFLPPMFILDAARGGPASPGDVGLVVMPCAAGGPCGAAPPPAVEAAAGPGHSGARPRRTAEVIRALGMT